MKLLPLTARTKPQTVPDTASSPGVLLYGGRDYAVGLLWLTVQEDSDKKLLKQRIFKTTADFYCLRSYVSQQHGFGWLSKGHRRGMPVAAAMVADQLVGEWHGVFEAENGWWYVQVRSDTITPNGDRFFASEEEAYQLFQDESTKNIWPHAYAPEKWRLPEGSTRELKLSELLDNLVTTALVPANLTASFGTAAMRNLVMGGISAMLLLMAGVLTVSLYDGGTVDVSQQAPVMPVQITPPPKLKAPEQLNESVSPQQLLRQCGETLAQLYQPLPGWQGGIFTCAVGKASLTWNQGTGTLGDARAIGAKHWPASANISFNSKIMTAEIKLGNLPKLELSGLVNQETALLYLEQNLQPMGGLDVKPVVPPEPPPPPPPSGIPGAPPPVAPPPAPPPYLEIGFISGFGPDKIGPLLDVPGMEIKQLQWDIMTAVWNYKLKWSYQKPGQAPTPTPNAGPVPAAAPAATSAPSSPQGGQP